jgi:drug/metabolite transporter (DMT)-like permease
LALNILILMLATAVIHAWWNTWLKSSGDRLAALATIAVGWGAVAALAIPFLGPPARAAWIYLGLSIAIHTTYALLLIRSYRFADLSVAYPIARGTAPLIVTIVSVIWLGDVMDLNGFLAILLIVAGVLSLGLSQSTREWRGIFLSLATGSLVGTYTLLDGIGGRVGDSPHAYVVWLLLFTAAPIPFIAYAVHGRNLFTLARPLWSKGIFAGVISAVSYWVVVWAMSIAPMGMVAAVRESSVVFAALFGGWLLSERVRWIPILLVFAGIVLIRLTN